MLVCILLVRMLGTFLYQDHFDLPKLFVFDSPAFYRLSTEHQRHDVHVLFGDFSYDVRNAHWRVNIKIKRKFTLFSVNTIKIFILCNENIQIFTRALLS